MKTKHKMTQNWGQQFLLKVKYSLQVSFSLQRKYKSIYVKEK